MAKVKKTITTKEKKIPAKVIPAKTKTVTVYECDNCRKDVLSSWNLKRVKKGLDVCEACFMSMSDGQKVVDKLTGCKVDIFDAGWGDGGSCMAFRVYVEEGDLTFLVHQNGAIQMREYGEDHGIEDLRKFRDALAWLEANT